MTTKKTSATLSRRLNKASKTAKKSQRRTTPFGRELVAAFREVLAHTRGEITLEGYTVDVPAQIDIASLRKRMKLSQNRFAERFGFDVTALQAWEQGRRQPDRAARLYLRVIEREPDAVERALRS